MSHQAAAEYALPCRLKAGWQIYLDTRCAEPGHCGQGQGMTSGTRHHKEASFGGMRSVACNACSTLHERRWLQKNRKQCNALSCSVGGLLSVSAIPAKTWCMNALEFLSCISHCDKRSLYDIYRKVTD